VDLQFVYNAVCSDPELKGTHIRQLCPRHLKMGLIEKVIKVLSNKGKWTIPSWEEKSHPISPWMFIEQLLLY
jgi:hypothetical protein